MVASRTESLLTHEPFETYRANSKQYLTSHQLADFRKCPALYHRKSRGLIQDEDRPAFVLGRAVHTWALEGRAVFESTFAVGGPINPRTGKHFGVATQAWAEWANAQGKPVLSDEQAELVNRVVAGITAHAGAKELLSAGVAEGVCRATYHEIACQIRVDWFNPARGIVDLKTCDDLTWFEADARRFGYAHQLAFYRAVLAAVTGVLHPVHMIAVEKKEPFRCGVWTLSDQTLSYCQRENEIAIEYLKTCETSGHWPTGYEEPRVFDAI